MPKTPPPKARPFVSRSALRSSGTETAPEVVSGPVSSRASAKKDSASSGNVNVTSASAKGKIAKPKHKGRNTLLGLKWEGKDADEARDYLAANKRDISGRGMRVIKTDVTYNEKVVIKNKFTALSLIHI